LRTCGKLGRGIVPSTPGAARKLAAGVVVGHRRYPHVALKALDRPSEDVATWAACDEKATTRGLLPRVVAFV
jgi:hypothetical protein